MKIEVGYGLEGVLPDGLAGQIIRDDFTPRFRENDYSGGIRNGVGRARRQSSRSTKSSRPRNSRNSTRAIAATTFHSGRDSVLRLVRDDRLRHARHRAAIEDGISRPVRESLRRDAAPHEPGLHGEGVALHALPVGAGDVDLGISARRPPGVARRVPRFGRQGRRTRRAAGRWGGGSGGSSSSSSSSSGSQRQLRRRIVGRGRRLGTVVKANVLRCQRCQRCQWVPCSFWRSRSSCSYLPAGRERAHAEEIFALSAGVQVVEIGCEGRGYSPSDRAVRRCRSRTMARRFDSSSRLQLVWRDGGECDSWPRPAVWCRVWLRAPVSRRRIFIAKARWVTTSLRH